jgi:hypothetical protein
MERSKDSTAAALDIQTPRSEDGRNLTSITLDPLEWIQRITSHIPDPGRHCQRSYGAYSNPVRISVAPSVVDRILRLRKNGRCKKRDRSSRSRRPKHRRKFRNINNSEAADIRLSAITAGAPGNLDGEGSDGNCKMIREDFSPFLGLRKPYQNHGRTWLHTGLLL